MAQRGRRRLAWADSIHMGPQQQEAPVQRGLPAVAPINLPLRLEELERFLAGEESHHTLERAALEKHRMQHRTWARTEEPRTKQSMKSELVVADKQELVVADKQELMAGEHTTDWVRHSGSRHWMQEGSFDMQVEAVKRTQGSAGKLLDACIVPVVVRHS